MSELKFRAAGVLGQGLLAGLFTTTRITRENYRPILQRRERGRRVIFTPWHGTLLPLAYAHRYEDVVVLVSEHADGEYITRVLHRYGYDTARGSSTRGGTRGLRGLIRAARQGRDLAVTPDGPRGPAEVFKPGAAVAAQITGLPLVAVGMGCSNAWHFRSWDRFMMPRPFSRIHVVYGDPLHIPRDAPDGEVKRLAAEAGRRLHAAQERARAAVGAVAPELPAARGGAASGPEGDGGDAPGEEQDAAPGEEPS